MHLSNFKLKIKTSRLTLQDATTKINFNAT